MTFSIYYLLEMLVIREWFLCHQRVNRYKTSIFFYQQYRLDTNVFCASKVGATNVFAIGIWVRLQCVCFCARNLDDMSIVFVVAMPA